MRSKKVILVCILIIGIIQFIQPARNKSGQAITGSFTKLANVPPDIQHALEVACYDCHSNNTRYPWYAGIQPFGWMMARHINNGKQELNFSEFDSLAKRRQVSKLEAIGKQLKSLEMPLQSYMLMHREVRLSTATRWHIAQWVSHLADSISKTTSQ
jgi:hypothetical protein